MIKASRDYWVISDTHWQHENILKFLKDDGTPVRPGFSCVQEMDELMIENWNADIKTGDYVYHLGDVTMGNYNRWATVIAPRLLGKKRLIVGNHDRLKGTKLMDFFERVELWKGFDDFGVVMTHIPIDKQFFRGKCERNIHGHIHDRGMNSPLYANVCVERTNYKPVNLEEIDKYFGN